jgi:decaprenylphospho-beta-D-ribofuranose 2-oxidase
MFKDGAYYLTDAIQTSQQQGHCFMTISAVRADLTNWSMTERSSCSVYKPRDGAEIMQALSDARTRGLSVIPHGAGHSYTDAAFNTHGAVIDLTGMCRILAWDPEQGIMRVEPGVTLRDVIRVALADGWWPPVTPSTTEATIGGCMAMNVTGKNAWKCGPFGEHVLSLNVLLAAGQVLVLSPVSTPDLFHAFVGSAGLLGIITSITLQLQRVASGYVDVVIRPATTLSEIFAIFQEEQSADLLEGLVDGFASGTYLGRGIVTCTTYSAVQDRASLRFPFSRIPDHLTMSLARYAGIMCRPAVQSGMRLANSMMYGWSARWDRGKLRRRPLFQSAFYPLAAFTGYRAILPHGIESLQAFVPRPHAEALFKEILRRSQELGFTPLWCVVKQHRPDRFLLSYQLDGFSLETYYQVVPQTAERLRIMLLELMDLVITAGGRLYLAKDGLLTSARYRSSMGDTTVDAFLQLKRHYDPDMLLQSNLFHRVFQAP